MTSGIFLYLPFITCLFWIVLNLLVHKNDKAFRALEYALVIVGIASLTEIGIASGIEYVSFTSFFARQLLIPLIIPSVFMYFSILASPVMLRRQAQVWASIPMSLLLTEIILIMIFHPDTINSIITDSIQDGSQNRAIFLLKLCTYWIFYGILIVEAIMWAIFTVNATLKKKAHLQLYTSTSLFFFYAVMEVAIITTGTDSWFTAISCIVLSGVLFIFSYSGLYHGKNNLRWADVRSMRSHLIPPSFDWSDQQPDVHIEMIKAIETGTTDNKGNEEQFISQADEENLKARFEKLMVTEKLFLKQGIRVSDIATRLNTNRTYISKLVNETYDMSFSDYINNLRIEYSKQYLLTHTEVRQSDIASYLGFPNASAFNNIFKKKTGVTPKIWLVTNSQKYRQQL